MRVLHAATFVVTLLATAVTSTRPAKADAAANPVDAEASISARRTGVGVNLGIGSAVGFAGVTLTRVLSDRGRIEAGGGWGLSGWQLSLMPKLTFGWPRLRLVAGAGLAVTLPTDGRVASGHPVWLNVDALGYEARLESGLAVSVALGFTGGLGGGRLCVPPDGCEPQFQREVTSFWLPQGRVGVAYWF